MKNMLTDRQSTPNAEKDSLLGQTVFPPERLMFYSKSSFFIPHPLPGARQNVSSGELFWRESPTCDNRANGNGKSS